MEGNLDISVLLPVRNGGRFLGQALSSIQAQVFSASVDLEIIAVDDGSTDETPAILNRWTSRLPLSLHTTDETSRGIVAALNLGLEHARGTYIARMDADDIMYPERLAMQWHFMESRPDVDLCGTRVRCFHDEHPLSFGVHRYQEWNNRLLTHDDMVRDLYIDCPMVHPTWFGRRSVFERLDGYRETNAAEDHDLIFRAVYGGYRLAKLPDILLDWRDHAARETRINPALKRTRLFRQKAWFFKRHDPLATRPLLVFGVGRYGKHILDALIAEGLDVRGIVDPYNRYVRSRIRNLPVLSLGDPTPPDALLINAYPVEGKPTPASVPYLENRLRRDWVL